MSALSNLFQDIADAIRTKTGDTATMSPASFPDNILSIVTGGSSGEGWIGTGGTIKPTSWAEQTIAHNLGVIPDIVVIYDSSSTGLTGSSVIYLFAIGFSAKFAQDVVFSEDAAVSMKCGLGFAYRPDTGTVLAMNINEGIESTNDNASYGIHDATETTFKIGCDIANLSTNLTYTWYAFARKS